MKRTLQNSGICIIVCLFQFTLCVHSVSLQTPVTTHKPNIEINRSVVVVQHVCKGKLLDGTEYNKPCPAEEVSTTIKPKNATDTEVVDLNERSSTKNEPTTNKNHESVISSTVSTTTSTTTVAAPVDSESIDRIGKPAEQRSHPNSKFNLTAGGIAALICVTVALSFYMGIMLWKKMVMNAYQNREILLNDDDIGDINDEDMRHFEAACIQIEA